MVTSQLQHPSHVKFTNSTINMSDAQPLVVAAVVAPLEPEPTLRDLMDVLKHMTTRFDGIDGRLDRIEGRLDGIDGRLDGIDGRLDGIDGRLSILESTGEITRCKLENSLKHRSDPLLRVPKADGQIPNCDYPTIENLIVGGSETLPSGATNTWNAQKSLDFIREYEPGYFTDGEADDERRSRPRRLKVAQLIGVTSVQMNFGLLTL